LDAYLPRNIKSLSYTLKGYPSVGIYKSFVMAKIVTKKKLPAEVETIIILFTNRVELLDTKIFAIMAIENPPSSELIVITWFENLFQYSNGIPYIKSVIFCSNQ
jgi:hypothetical protein